MLVATAVVIIAIAPSAAPPKGIAAGTPLDEVKALDAVLPSTLRATPELEPLLATDDELKKMLKAMKINPADLEVVLETSRKERTPPADLPATYAPTIALVLAGDKRGNTHDIRFYDAKGYRLDYALVGRTKGTWALVGAPRGQPSVVADDLESFHADAADGRDALPLYFEKSDAGWKQSPYPAADGARCVAMMHGKAKEIFDAQQAYRAKHKAFASGEELTTLGDGFMGWSKLTPIDADHFKAEVNRHGGKVTVDDTGTIVDVAPCVLEPGKAPKKKTK